MSVKLRHNAFEVLQRVFQQNAFSNIELDKLRKSIPVERDFNLLSEIVLGTIQNKIYLEYVLAKFINLKKTSNSMIIILIMSLYQFHFLKKIPVYAIVNEAVDVAKKVNYKLAGFVNGVLKKIFATKNDTAWEVLLENEIAKQLVIHSIPNFLYELLAKQYDSKIINSFIANSLQKPLLSVRVNTLKYDAHDFFDNYKDELEIKKSAIAKNCFLVNKNIFKTSLFSEGKITFQDQASVLVSEMLNPTSEQRVLDMCAAPGSKTTHLAALMLNQGELCANEISKQRCSLIKHNLDRMGVINTKIVNSDALMISDLIKFDKILLDAPCSGLGVIKRKPEIKYRLKAQADLDRIVDLQSELLDVAYKNLKPNGILCYSTCSILAEENETLIKRWLSKTQNMQLLDHKKFLGFEFASDGFNIFILKKIA